MPDPNSYIDGLYNTIKLNVPGFKKTPQEFSDALNNDAGYRQGIYTMLKDNIPTFTKTTSEFNDSVIKKISAKDAMVKYGIDPTLTENQKSQINLQKTVDAAKQKQENETHEAAVNTAKVYFENRPLELKGFGLSPQKQKDELSLSNVGKKDKFSLSQLKNITPFQQKVAELKSKVKSGILITATGNDGKLIVARPAGKWDDAKKGVSDAWYANDRINHYNSLSEDEQIKYLEEHKPDEYLPVKNDTESASYAAGGVIPMVGKMATGAAAGALIAASIPATGGLDTPVAAGGASALGAWMATVPDIAKQGQFNAEQEAYHKILQNNPNIDKKEALKKAKEAGVVGYAEGLATGTAMNFLGQGSIPEGTGQGLWKAAGQFLKNQPQSMAEIGGLSALGSVAADETKKALGVPITSGEMWDKAGKAMNSGAIMQLAFNVSHGIMAAPKYVKAQSHEVLTKVNPETLQKLQEDAVNSGQLSQEQVDATNKDLQDYKAARAKIPESQTHNEERTAVIAGLIQKKANLEKAKTNVDKSYHKEIDDQIEAANQRIELAKNSPDPIKYAESDDVDGSINFTPKDYQSLSKAEKEGVVVPKDYGEAEVTETGEGENKKYTPKATFIEKQGGLEIKRTISIEGESFKDKSKAQDAADNALREHFYENGLSDNLKPEKKSAVTVIRPAENKPTEIVDKVQLPDNAKEEKQAEIIQQPQDEGTASGNEPVASKESIPARTEVNKVEQPTEEEVNVDNVSKKIHEQGVDSLNEAEKTFAKENGSKIDDALTKLRNQKGEVWNNRGTTFNKNEDGEHSFVGKDGETYTISHTTNSKGTVSVKVRDKNGKTVSSAYFWHNGDGSYSIARGSKISSEIQGIGLAKAVYDYTDNNIGKIKRTETTTDDGGNLWSKNKKAKPEQVDTPSSTLVGGEGSGGVGGDVVDKNIKTDNNEQINVRLSSGNGKAVRAGIVRPIKPQGESGEIIKDESALSSKGIKEGNGNGEAELDVALQKMGERKVPDGKGSWRAEFNKEKDPFRKSSILRAIADVSKDANELSDIREAAKGMPEESNIIHAVEQSLKETTKAETPTTNVGVEEGSGGVGGDVEGFGGGTKIYRAGGKGRYFTTDKQYIQEGGFKGETREFEIPKNTKLLDLREEDYKGILDLATEEERSILRKPQAKNSIEAKEQGNIVDAILKRNGYDGYIIKDAGETKDFDTVVFRKDKSPDLKAVEQSLSPKEVEQNKETVTEQPVIPEGGEPPMQGSEPLSTSDGGGNEIPPVEPPVEGTPGSGKGSVGNEKGILNRLFTSEKISKKVKDVFETKGLKYAPKSQEEARVVAKDIIGEFGYEQSIGMAESGRFDGDVNSMIFAESIDQLSTLEGKSTTPEQATEYAAKWADYSIRYDELARDKGRFISAIYDFYKKSPLGTVIKENRNREGIFNDWFKGKEVNYKELFDEIKKTTEGKNAIKEEFETLRKEERASDRATKRKNIEDFFDKAKFKGDALYSTVIPPKLINGAIELMKKAFLAGESIGNAVKVAIDHISKEIKDWDAEKFRSEWESKLSIFEKKSKETIDKTSPEYLLQKQKEYLEKFSKKLSGLNDQQKEQVIQKSIKKLIENGALEFDEFKKIIAQVLGVSELTPEQAARMKELSVKINSLQDVATEARLNNRTEKGLADIDRAVLEAEEAAHQLDNMVYVKAAPLSRAMDVIKLNTLGLTSLIKNISYNVSYQPILFTKSLFKTSMDYSIYGVSQLSNKVFGTKIILPENSTFLAQKGYFKGVGQGLKRSLYQVKSGLQDRDYFSKEVRISQIRPRHAWKDLWAWRKGEKFLTNAQVADKIIQGTAGVNAEVIARLLNVGDKWQKFGAEGYTTELIAKKELGIKDPIEKKFFAKFPKEESYRIYKEKGLSDEEAMAGAEEIEKRIIKTGEKSITQQDNWLSDKLKEFDKYLDKKSEDDAIYNVANGLTKILKGFSMPFVKIPLNVAWNVMNFVNPELAVLQSGFYGYIAIKNRLAGDMVKARENTRIAKDWMAHAATGTAMLAATGYLANIGAIRARNDFEEDKARESRGESNYGRQYTLNVSLMNRLATGGSTEEQDGDVWVDLSWFGIAGNIMNIQAKRVEEKKQDKDAAEKDNYFDDLTSRLTSSAAEGLDNGVFSGTNNLLSAYKTGGGYVDSWMIGMSNLGMNFFEPATYAQFSKATMDEKSVYKAESLWAEIVNNQKQRDIIFRQFAGKPPSDVTIWGEPYKKAGGLEGVAFNMLGFEKTDASKFGMILYDDYKKSKNTGFFPPAVLDKIKVNGADVKLPVSEATDLKRMIGQKRKSMVEPFIMGKAYYAGKTYSQIENESDKVEALKTIYDQAREIAIADFRNKYPKYQETEKTHQQKTQEEKEKKNKEKLLKQVTQ